MEGALADLTEEDMSKPKSILDDELKLLDEPPTFKTVSSKMAQIGKTNENFRVSSLIA